MTTAQRDRIETMYLEMFDMLMAYARSVLRNEAQAEEAVQETFRIACQKPECLCESVNPQGWLVQTLKFTIRNMQSNQASALRLLEKCRESHSSNAAFSEDRLDLHIVYEDVADTEEFKLLSEMAIDGLSHLEMAQRRGISVSACKKRVQRAKEMLKKKMEN